MFTVHRYKSSCILVSGSIFKRYLGTWSRYLRNSPVTACGCCAHTWAGYCGVVTKLTYKNIYKLLS